MGFRWGAALELEERAALIRPSEVNSTSAIMNRRVSRWRGALGGRERLDAFLASLGIDHHRFCVALGASPLTLETHCRDSIPPWVREVTHILLEKDIPPATLSGSVSDLLGVVHPLVSDYVDRLRAQVYLLNNTQKLYRIESAVVTSLEEGLLEALLLLLARPVILELNIARLEGELRASSPRARADEFFGLLREKASRRAFFNHYPGLARLCQLRCVQWYESSCELLQRFCLDGEGIGAMCRSQSGVLASARIADSDPHRQGRRVVVIELGDGRRAVYKPRSQEAATAYNGFLRWISSRSGVELHATGVLNRGEYGWCEFVESAPCKSKEELELYYVRVGGLLAVLRFLGAVDCHFENLIASGSDPILVDVETLCAPKISGESSTDFDDALRNSALATGLLPEPAIVDGQTVDLSGIGARPNQPTPLTCFGFEWLGTDEQTTESTR